MAYFSGLSDVLRITFVQIMILSTIAIVIFLYGMMINFQKWGQESQVTALSLRKEQKEVRSGS